MRKLGSKKIGLVGVGNMGTSILEGILKNNILTHSNIWVYDKISEKAKNFSKKTHVHIASSIKELCQKTDVLLLGIKPQDFSDFASMNKSFLKKKHCIISILAGLTTERIQKALGKELFVVRAMPNLCAKVGESMTILCGKNRGWLSYAKILFAGCGVVAVLPEKKLDLVTAVSGSGPAYFFHLMELMTDFGVKQGLPEKVAATLAVQTGVGATLLAKGSEFSCQALREKVTSKKGTTEAALNILKQKKFGKIFHQALRAAMRRSRALRRRM